MPLEPLPPELAAEILSRLPVKVILHFRCVSKRWRTFIGSQFFIKAHLSRSIQSRNNHFLLVSNYNSGNMKSVDLDFVQSAVDLHNPLHYEPVKIPRKGGLLKSQYSDLPEHSQIIFPRWLRFTSQHFKILVWGTCNGLVLMSSASSACLWNPSTRKHLILPNLEVGRSSLGWPLDLYGFGYGSASDDYKVIKIFKYEKWKSCGESDIQYQVWVYRLRSNSWSEVAKTFPPNMKCDRQPGVLVCETLHWPVKVKYELDHEEHGFILAFDLKTEEYRMFSQPKCQNPEFYSRLGTLNGSLCLIYSYLPVGFEIWMMRDHGVDESWTRLTLQLEDFISYPGGFSKATLNNGKAQPYWQWHPPPFLSEFGLNIMLAEHFGIARLDHSDVCIVSLVSLERGAAADQQNEGVN